MSGISVILITGAASGIGKVTAELLAKRGHRVFAAMRDPNSRNVGAAEELRGLGCEIVEIDVTSDTSAQNGVREVTDKAGKIDVLVNAAGIMFVGHSESFSVAQMQRMFETNLYGPFRLLQAVLPGMRARRDGLLITMSSVTGRIVAPLGGIYSASKCALEGLAECVGYEVTPFNIDSVIVEPGLFQTNLAANMEQPEDAATEAQYTAANRALLEMPAKAGEMVTKAGVSTDPRDVATLISKLIDTPKGERPIRVAVGLDLGLTELNTIHQRYQRAFLALMGLESLERVSLRHEPSSEQTWEQPA